MREEVGRLRVELHAHAVPGRPESREAQGVRAAIERRQQEMDRLERVADRRAAEVARNRDLLRRAYEVLNEVPQSRIRAVEVDPKLKKGEDLKAALARIRDEIAALAAERRQVEAAPLPSGLVKQAMTAQVEALAAEGQLDVTDLFHGRALALPRLIQATAPNGPLPAFERLPADLGAVVLSVIAPALIDHLNAKIDALAREFDAVALAPEEKAARLKALDERFLALERIEEAILDRLGGTVARRDGVSPLAALGVEVLDAEPVEADALSEAA